MTNKQMIKRLRGIRSDYKRDCKYSLFKDLLYRKDIEALDLAITLLENNIYYPIYCNQCWTGAKYRTNFCPNCGAKMTEEQNNVT